MSTCGFYFTFYEFWSTYPRCLLIPISPRNVSPKCGGFWYSGVDKISCLPVILWLPWNKIYSPAAHLKIRYILPMWGTNLTICTTNLVLCINLTCCFVDSVQCFVQTCSVGSDYVRCFVQTGYVAVGPVQYTGAEQAKASPRRRPQWTGLSVWRHPQDVCAWWRRLYPRLSGRGLSAM